MNQLPDKIRRQAFDLLNAESVLSAAIDVVKQANGPNQIAVLAELYGAVRILRHRLKVSLHEADIDMTPEDAVEKAVYE